MLVRPAIVSERSRMRGSRALVQGALPLTIGANEPASLEALAANRLVRVSCAQSK